MIGWACPEHRAALTKDGDAFLCPEGESFPVRGGIPRFVPDTSYADAFGLQWQTYRKTQLDSYSGTTITRDRLRRCLGEELWNTLAGKQVLECGCGAGRFTEILLERGAVVTSVDLSSAVDANVQNCPVSQTHRVAQADILRLPFQPQQFDVVLCLGVIQHTPSPEATIASLAGQVRPGGWLVIDHYTYALSWWTKTSVLLRPILRRVSPATGVQWTERLVRWFLPLHARTRHNRILHAFAGRISPILTYYRLHPELNDGQQREWALLDTHDLLTDYYKHFRNRDEIRAMLIAAGLTAIWCDKGGNGIEARAMRPVS